MNQTKTKAPINILEFIPYNIFACFKNLEEKIELKVKFKNKNQNQNKKQNTNHEDYFYYLKNKKDICPQCNSKEIIKSSYKTRKLIILNEGKIKIKIKQYKCKKCGKIFNTDLSDIVYKNCNITKPVIDEILTSYAIHGSSIYKIKYELKKQFNVDISHQSIENIIKNYKNENKTEYWSYSGYYLFDSLWVKINGKWNYLLSLFDVKQNTLVSVDLVPNESEKTIKNFLTKSTKNQKRIAITTDLKIEYRRPITELRFKHQFCKFHTKQKINRDIKKYIKQNKLTKKEEKEIEKLKKEIFKILDSKKIETSKKILKKLIEENKENNNIIIEILWEFIIPYFKNLTYAKENRNIESTSNKIENIFQKVFPKSIKKRMKTKYGILNRFKLKLEYWNEKNKI